MRFRDLLRGLVTAGLLLAPGTPALAEGTSDRLARLETALDREEGVRAVKRLQSAYSQYLEEGRWGELRPLFTGMATARFGTKSVVGREAIVRCLKEDAGGTSTGLPPGRLNTRYQLQPIVTLGTDGRTAKATWHEIATTGQYGSWAAWSGGVYENDYVVDRGVWRIAALHFLPQYRGAYEDNGFKAPAAWNIPYHFDAKHVGVTIPEAALVQPAGENRQAAEVRAGSILARAQHLADETAVQNLQHAYGYYLDRKMWEDVADLFADRGTIDLGGGGRLGRAGILAALEQRYGNAGLRHGEMFDHIMMGTLVTIGPDGRHATARTQQLAMLGVTGEGARWEQGTYESSFEKQGGVWKIKALRYVPRLDVDYDRGWARDSALGTWPELRRVPISSPNPGRSSADPRSLSVASGTLETSLGRARQMIDAAIAVDAVENLNSAYGYTIDESAWDEMADLFAEQGAKEITGAGVYVGRERIRAILKLRGPLGGRNPKFYTIHQLTQPVIDVAADGRTAKARMRLFQTGGDADGSTAAWIGGIYENSAVFEDGEWKFLVQDLHHMFNASYRGGWARIAPRAVGPAQPPTVPAAMQGLRQGLGGASSPTSFVAKMPPDRPIRMQRQYAFPDIVEPAFHYRNPVSGRAPADLLP